MIQGGGMDHDFAQKQTLATIENEANNGLPNNRGTIAMARTQIPIQQVANSLSIAKTMLS